MEGQTPAIALIALAAGFAGGVCYKLLEGCGRILEGYMKAWEADRVGPRYTKEGISEELLAEAYAGDKTAQQAVDLLRARWERKHLHL